MATRRSSAATCRTRATRPTTAGVLGALIFARHHGAWKLEATLTDDRENDNIDSGAMALSADGDTAIIGDHEGGSDGEGAVWVFKRRVSDLLQQGRPRRYPGHGFLASGAASPCHRTGASRWPARQPTATTPARWRSSSRSDAPSYAVETMWLVLIFIIVPIIELAVIIQVGEAIGVWWTIGLLLFDSLFGAWLLRHQGGAAWRRFNAAVAERRVPAKEVVDGVLIIFGGALLITPGFISDIFGVLFLLPPTRAVIRKWLIRRGSFGFFVSVGRTPGFGGGGRGEYVDSTAHEIKHDPPQLPS
jgi:UPF0716 protein FxsA